MSQGRVASYPFTIGQWTQLIVQLGTTMEANPGKYFMYIYYGSFLARAADIDTTAVVTTTQSDVFRIGGFIGEIQELLIFSPTSVEVNSRTPSFILHNKTIKFRAQQHVR